MFPDDIHDLSVGKPVKTSVFLRALNPFVDQHGIIRVGGRIKEAMVENKHSCIIHATHAIAKAVVHDAHNVAHFGWSGHLALSENTSGWSKQGLNQAGD